MITTGILLQYGTATGTLQQPATSPQPSQSTAREPERLTILCEILDTMKPGMRATVPAPSVSTSITVRTA